MTGAAHGLAATSLRICAENRFPLGRDTKTGPALRGDTRANRIRAASFDASASESGPSTCILQREHSIDRPIPPVSATIGNVQVIPGIERTIVILAHFRGNRHGFAHDTRLIACRRATESGGLVVHEPTRSRPLP